MTTRRITSRMKTIVTIVTMIVTCELLADFSPYNDAVVTSVDGGSVHTVNNHNYYKQAVTLYTIYLTAILINYSQLTSKETTR